MHLPIALLNLGIRFWFTTKIKFVEFGQNAIESKNMHRAHLGSPFYTPGFFYFWARMSLVVPMLVAYELIIKMIINFG